MATQTQSRAKVLKVRKPPTRPCTQQFKALFTYLLPPGPVAGDNQLRAVLPVTQVGAVLLVTQVGVVLLVTEVRAVLPAMGEIAPLKSL